MAKITHFTGLAWIIAAFALLSFFLIHIPAADARPIPFNRAKSGDGFFSFTASPDEHQTELSRGYVKEKACESCQSPLFYIYDAKLPGSVPTVLFQHSGTNASIYSSDTAEMGNLIKQGWTKVRIDGYVFPTRQPGSAEIFHLYNTATGNNLYTTSPDERDYYLVTRSADGWTSMASLGFTQPQSSTGVGVLKRGVIKLDDATLETLQTPTTDGKLVFNGSPPLLNNVKPGNLLYAEVSSKAPTGILARVDAINRQGFQTVLKVSLPHLRDVFEQLHLFVDSQRIIFDPTSPDAVVTLGSDCPVGEEGCVEFSATGVTCSVLTTAPDGSPALADAAPLMEYLANMPMVEPDAFTGYRGLTCEYNSSVSVTQGVGTITVTMDGAATAGFTMDLDASFGNSNPKNDYFTTNVTPSANVSLTTTVSGALTYAPDPWLLYKITGYLPIPGTWGALSVIPKLKLFAGYEAELKGEVTLSAAADGSLTGGIYYNSQDASSAKYHDEKWHLSKPTCGDNCFTFTSGSQVADTMSLKGYIKTEVSIGVGDSFGTAELGVKDILTTYLKGIGTAVPNPPSLSAELRAGVSLGIQAKTEFRGVEHPLSDLYTVFEYEKILWEESISGATATTDAVTNKTQTTVTLNGTVNPNGLSTTVKFQYGTTTSYGSSTSSVTLTGSTDQAVTADVTLLTCGTTYHFRVWAKNTSGTTKGSDVKFTTSACATTSVTTGSATNVTTTGATLNGTVNPNGLSTTVKFQYGTTTSYGSTTSSVTLTGSTDQAVTMDVTGLTCGTKYYFRVWASNSSGTTKGLDGTFTTSACTTTGTPYTVTATAGTGGSVSLASQSVTSGFTAAFTVTPNSGYTTNTTVVSTCATGSWSGTTYTTGAVTANCAVSFSFTQGGGGTAPSAFTLSGSAYCNGTTPAVSLSGWGSSGATSFDLYRNGSLYSSANTGSTYYNTASVTAGTTYTYYVIAKNAYGSYTSTTISVTASSSCTGGTAPSAFTLSGSAYCNGTTPAVSLSGWGSSGATSFDLYRNGSLYSSANTGSTYYNTASVTAGTTYTYYVIAKNAYGSYTSTTISVTASSSCGGTTIPSTPTAYSPGTTSSPGPTTSSATVTLSWSAVSGATYYDFGVRDMISWQLVVDQTSAGTSYSATLTAGRQYRWNVAACNGAGCSSYTTVLYFQTP